MLTSRLMMSEDRRLELDFPARHEQGLLLARHGGGRHRLCPGHPPTGQDGQAHRRPAQATEALGETGLVKALATDSHKPQGTYSNNPETDCPPRWMRPDAEPGGSGGRRPGSASTGSGTQSSGSPESSSLSWPVSRLAGSVLDSSTARSPVPSESPVSPATICRTVSSRVLPCEYHWP